MEDQNKELIVDSIVKGIAYTENGGKPDIENPSAGKSGELKSIFQFEPATWKGDAKKFLGNAEAPITADNETYVMREKVKKWMDEGKTVSEMASIHNSGNPNAYKENHKGVNKYGVKYDTPAYAQKVLDYSKNFFKEKSQTNIDNNGTALTTQKQMEKNTEPLNTVLDIVKKAQQNTETPKIQDNAISPGTLSNQAVSKEELASKIPKLFNGVVRNSTSKVKQKKARGLLARS